MRIAFGHALSLAALWAAGCTSHGTGPDPVSEPAPIGLRLEYTYQAIGNDINLKSDSIQGFSCDTSGTVIPETYPGGSVQTRFFVYGDSLWFYVSSDLDTNVFIQGIRRMSGLLYTRLSGGPGLPGRWRYRGYQIRILAGTLSDSDRAIFEKQSREELALSEIYEKEMEIRGDSIYSGERTHWAASVMYSWNRQITPDGRMVSVSDLHPIRAKALDDSTVEYKGLTTGETVIEAFHGNFSNAVVNFTSDNPAHKPYAQGAFVCNRHEAEWFPRFSAENGYPISAEE